MTETNYWGYHLLLDCKSCDIEAIKSSEIIAAFVKELVTAIDMKAYGEPIIVNFTVAVEVVQKYFTPTSIKADFIHRQA
jgi:hypothetical protein